MKKIDDFGTKIGGAKKDIWAAFHSLSNDEQNNFATKANLWPRPRYEALLKNGCEKEALFWRNEMRKAVKSRASENPSAYVEFCTSFRTSVEACETIKDIEQFYANDINQFMKHVEGNKWKYASKTFRQFFNGNTVLRYINHTERISEDFKNSSFMKGRDKKESEKYCIVHITKDNLDVSDYKNNRFANKVKCDNGFRIFYDSQNFSLLLEDTGEIHAVLYGNKKIGIYETLDKANDAIENHKKKISNEKLSNKKDVFLPPHLSSIERTGSNYNFFRMTDGNVLLARYGLRGGEFGNYTSSKDRLGSVNMAYDAFEDLHHALGISAKDIGLGGKLAIAFGARGRGNAMAHYEPDKNVINMTKMRGAGSLAHEWAHAMDCYIAKNYNIPGFFSNNITKENIPDSMKSLVNSMMLNHDGTETEFYKASKSFDSQFKKSGNGYWASNHEMFARAFVCYVKDKLNGKKSDYLIGHAECATDGITVAYPTGKEREIINHNFDEFFKDMLKENVFTKLDDKKMSALEKDNTIEVMFFEGAEGQMRFC